MVEKKFKTPRKSKPSFLLYSANIKAQRGEKLCDKIICDCVIRLCENCDMEIV